MENATEIRPAWKIVLTSKVFYASALLLICGAIMNDISSQSIELLFPNRQPIYDTLFHILPYIPWTQYLTDPANIFSIILLIVYLFPRRWQKLPLALAVLGLGYLIRSLLTLIDPFGGPLGNVVHYGITNIHQYGQFPSGHVLFVTLVYLLINSTEAKLLKGMALGSMIIEIIALLLSHGHYSIDIVGGLLVGYFVYNSLKDHSELIIKR